MPPRDDVRSKDIGPIEEHGPDTKRSAARMVASASGDATECAELLAALGLSAEDGLRDP